MVHQATKTVETPLINSVFASEIVRQPPWLAAGSVPSERSIAASQKGLHLVGGGIR